MLCESGRCPVGQETIKQEQQCKTMKQKQRAIIFINQSTINEINHHNNNQKKYIEQKKIE